MGVRGVMTGAAGAVDLVGNAANAVINAPFEVAGRARVLPYDNVRRIAEEAADALGLAKPASRGEKLTNAIVEGGAGGLASAGGAGAIPAVRGVGGAMVRELAEAPLKQAISGAAATGVGEKVKQEGGGPIAQMAASLAAGGGAYVGLAGAQGALRGARAPKTAADIADAAMSHVETPPKTAATIAEEAMSHVESTALPMRRDPSIRDTRSGTGPRIEPLADTAPATIKAGEVTGAGAPDALPRDAKAIADDALGQIEPAAGGGGRPPEPPLADAAAAPAPRGMGDNGGPPIESPLSYPDAVTADKAALRNTFRRMRESVDPKKIPNAMLNVARYVHLASGDAAHGVAKAHPKIREAQTMADMLSTNPGSGRHIGATIEEATQIAAHSTMDRVVRAMPPHATPATQRAIVDGLTGRSSAPGAPKVGKVVEELREVLDDHHAYLTEAGVEVGYTPEFFPRDIDMLTVNNKGTPYFITQATKAYQAAGLDTGIAKRAASELLTKLEGYGDALIDLPYASTSSHLKGRTWPKEADDIMREFYVDDVAQNLSHYLSSTSHIAEFTRRFGRNGEGAEALFTAMRDQGMPKGDLASMRESYGHITGLARRGEAESKLARAESALRTIGQLTLLPLNVVTQVPEIMAIGTRTGDATAGFKGIVDAYSGLKAQAGTREGDRYLAEAAGIVNDAIVEANINGRFGGEGLSEIERNTTARFMRVTGVHGITVRQRITATGHLKTYLLSLLKDLDGPSAKSSQRLLNDLGIRAEDTAEVRAFMEQPGGVTGANIGEKTKAASLTRVALNRAVDQTIQTVHAADKPSITSHPVGRLIHGLSGFSYAYQRNVLTRVARETGMGLTGKGGLSSEDRLKLLGPTLALGVATAVGMGWNEVKNAAKQGFRRDTRPPWKRVLADFSSTGGLGLSDFMAQMAAYGPSGDGLISGPYLSRPLKLAKNTYDLRSNKAEAFRGANTTNNNTAERNFLKAFIQAVVVPVASAGASFVPYGGFAGSAVRASLIAGASPVAIDKAVDTVKPKWQKKK